MRTTRVLFVALLALVFAALPAQAGAGATTSTVVLHGLTESEFFADDICGPRANTTTFTIRTQVIHLTEGPNGGLSAQFTETGTYRVDFVDPSLADQTSQFTESIHFTATPGATEVFSLTFHDFPTGIRIFERVHVTVVDGRPIVERQVTKVTGCP